MTVALPESVIATVVLMYRPSARIDNAGVGAIVVNGQRYDVPHDCSEAQAIEIITRILKEERR